MKAYDDYRQEGAKLIGPFSKARWALKLMRAGKLPPDPVAAATIFNRLELAEKQQPGVGAQKMFEAIVNQTG